VLQADFDYTKEMHMTDKDIRTASGRSLQELTMDALLAGELSTADFRISGDTLRDQADAAEAAGYRQFAENLRRAAELTAISNQEVIEIYSKLRPGRTSYGELVALAEHMEKDCAAPLTAALVREAADVYLKRGFVEKT
jgi:propanediol dehydratase small subunit